MNKLFIGILSVIIILGAIAIWQKDFFIKQAFAPTKSSPADLPLSSPNTTTSEPEVVAQDLNIPWELVFLPDKSLLVTQRPGQLVKIGADKTVIPIEGVRHVGEGGLLGMALHPDFAKNHFIYLYSTTTSGNTLTNRVERYTLSDTKLSDRNVILYNIPGSQNHDGGRIAFGPDRNLYITTGDAGVEKNAQDINSLSGKILRMRDDGSIPSDNPFQNAVYSYGHRNPQGITWDANGQLWETEHGRSGITSGFDEVNRIQAGHNYGWPEIEGDKTRQGMESPYMHSGASTTWAPSGALVFERNLFFAGLRGQALYRVSLAKNSNTKVTAFLQQQFGRLRSVTVGPDGMLYILTNNRDGRGTPKANDDKIIRINPDTLQ